MTCTTRGANFNLIAAGEAPALRAHTLTRNRSGPECLTSLRGWLSSSPYKVPRPSRYDGPCSQGQQCLPEITPAGQVSFCSACIAAAVTSSSPCTTCRTLPSPRQTAGNRPVPPRSEPARRAHPTSIFFRGSRPCPTTSRPTTPPKPPPPSMLTALSSSTAPPPACTSPASSRSPASRPSTKSSGAPRRRHPGLEGQARLRAEGRRGPLGLVRHRDQHRRQQISARPGRHARARDRRPPAHLPRR